MLHALLKELDSQKGIQLTVLLDWRMDDIQSVHKIKTIRVEKEQCVFDVLSIAIADVDMVWPIAPEMDWILQKTCQLIESQSKQLLNSSSSAVTICSDKLLTEQVLNKHEIATVKTYRLDLFAQDTVGEWVIKPRLGMGCLECCIVDNSPEFLRIIQSIKSPSDYIVQPYIQGAVLSLSCLFKEGRAWLLCCNEQRMSIKQGKIELTACIINIPTDRSTCYLSLINKLAQAMIGLSAYVGVDIIQPKDGEPKVLDINPRLTTSYVGINQAIGLNVAKIVIEMLGSEPTINKMTNKQIEVWI